MRDRRGSYTDWVNHLISSLPSAKITNPDITRIINSDEIQSVVRPAGQKIQKRPWTQKKNPLVNKAILFRLNPYAKTLRRQELRMCRLSGRSIAVYNFSFFSQTGASEEEAREEGEAEDCFQGIPRHPFRTLISYPCCVHFDSRICEVDICPISFQEYYHPHVYYALMQKNAIALCIMLNRTN